MNEYRVIFERENGTRGAGYFVSPTEAQAKKDFVKVYRFNENQIIGVELYRANAVSTEVQEKEGAGKIRKIVEEHGYGSSVSAGLDGCLEDAEANIKNSSAHSMKSRWKEAEKRLAEAREENGRLKQKLAESERILERERDKCRKLEEGTMSACDIRQLNEFLSAQVLILAEVSIHRSQIKCNLTNEDMSHYLCAFYAMAGFFHCNHVCNFNP